MSAHHTNEPFQADVLLFLIETSYVYVPAGHHHVFADAVGRRFASQAGGHVVLVGVFEQFIVEVSHFPCGDRKYTALCLCREEICVEVEGQYGGIVVVGVVAHEVGIFVVVEFRVCIAYGAILSVELPFVLSAVDRVRGGQAEGHGQTVVAGEFVKVKQTDLSAEVLVSFVDSLRQFLHEIRFCRQAWVVGEIIQVESVFVWNIITQREGVIETFDIIKTCYHGPYGLLSVVKFFWLGAGLCPAPGLFCGMSPL